MSNKDGKNTTKAVLTALAVCAVIVTLFIFTAKMPYGNEAVLIVLNALALISGVLIITLDKDKQRTLRRCCLLAFVLSALCLALYIPFEKYGLMGRLRDLERLRGIILATGNWGVAVFFLITLASVIILPVPASLIIVVGTLVYGSWVSFAVSAAATFIGSLVCFALGRKLGKKLLYWLFDCEKVDKYSEILGRKGRVPFIVMMFLPFFPDDMICISAGMTGMSFRFFAVSVGITRTLYILAVSFLGSGEIIPFHGWGIAVWVVIFALCIFLSWLINKIISEKHVEKNKIPGAEKRSEKP